MMTRRSILSMSAAAVAGTAANSALAIGVIGTGNRGTYVAATMAKNTPARVVALCDLYDNKMEDAKKQIGVENPKLYKDFHKLLANPEIDAIILATPVFLHAEHFEAAVKSGKHIYIEKPASADVEGCKRIMRAADAADRKINISFGFQRRYAELYLKGKAIADSGALGTIRMGSARFIKSEPAFTRRELPPPKSMDEKIAGWYGWRDLNGDLIVENNVHSIDVLNWFLGGHPLSAIGAGGRTLDGAGDVRDHNFVAFEYKNGVQGQLTGATLAPRGYRDVVEQFYGEKGFLETSENHLRHFRGPGQETIEKPARNNTTDSVAAFVKRIQEGKPENTGVRGAESTLTAILGRMAWTSAVKSPGMK